MLIRACDSGVRGQTGEDRNIHGSKTLGKPDLVGKPFWFQSVFSLGWGGGADERLLHFPNTVRSQTCLEDRHTRI